MKDPFYCMSGTQVADVENHLRLRHHYAVDQSKRTTRTEDIHLAHGWTQFCDNIGLTGFAALGEPELNVFIMTLDEGGPAKVVKTPTGESKGFETEGDAEGYAETHFNCPYRIVQF